MNIPAALIETLLDQSAIATLASFDAESGIHQVPIVFVRLGDALWSPVDGKPKSGTELKRLKNVRARPQVSVLLDHYESDWSKLWWLRIAGTATVIDANLDLDPHVAAAVAALCHKYPQYQHTPVLTEQPTLLRIAPDKTVGWCADLAALQGDG